MTRKRFVLPIALLCTVGCAPAPQARREPARAPASTESRAAVVQNAIRTAHDSDVRRFLERLPESTQEYASPPWAVDESVWREYVGQVSGHFESLGAVTGDYSDSGALGADGVDLSTLLSTPLRLKDQRVVLEKWDKTGNVGGIGWATCEGLQPLIVYDPVSASRLTALSFMWFRQHEFAHHLQGHVVCVLSGPQYKTGIAWEREADCSALAQMSTIGKIERDIRIAASERFFVLDAKETFLHPSGRERGAYIRKGNC